MTRYAALLLGLVIVSLGALGLAQPSTFMQAVEFFQAGHRLYLAAALRLVFGVILFVAAKDARWPRALRFVAFVLVLLALLTPFSTHPIPSVAWGWWSDDFVRPWAFVSIALGVFIIAAVAPPRDLED
jgi:hypothetical protein